MTSVAKTVVLAAAVLLGMATAAAAETKIYGPKFIACAYPPSVKMIGGKFETEGDAETGTCTITTVTFPLGGNEVDEEPNYSWVECAYLFDEMVDFLASQPGCHEVSMRYPGILTLGGTAL
jgi:hypothetical protein